MARLSAIDFPHLLWTNETFGEGIHLQGLAVLLSYSLFLINSSLPLALSPTPHALPGPSESHQVVRFTCSSLFLSAPLSSPPSEPRLLGPGNQGLIMSFLCHLLIVTSMTLLAPWEMLPFDVKGMF